VDHHDDATLADLVRRHGEHLAALQALTVQHDARMAQLERIAQGHDERLARMDRQFDRLLEIAADVAATNDRLEDQLRRTHPGDLVRKLDDYMAHQEEVNTRRALAIERIDTTLARLIEQRTNGREP
jgi:hypothetical protein